MEPTKARRDEFLTLYDDFATSYLSRPKGQEHLASYNTLRQQARENFDAIVVAAERGEDVTDNVLTKLLPYTDSQAHRERGFWVHIAPAITGDVRKWFEKAGWTKPEDWRAVADAILNFLQRCTENPADLAAAAEEFADLPYSRGFQTGMLTPILNALRPDDFLLINNKSRRVINYFANTSFGQALTDYAVTNGAGRTLIEALGPDMKSGTPTVARPGDIFDTFSHWLVGIEKHDFGESSYWKIAPGENAWQWEECRGAGFIAVGWDELGDLSRLTRAEFESRRDDLVAQFPEWKEGGVDQVWKFAHIREGDRIIANRGTTEVLGIGTVAGPYTFVPNVRHGHRLPVTWDDLRLRQVNEPGWRRTLIKLDREKFAAIALAPATDGPPEELPSECPFSEKTFELLGQLHDKSSRDFYLGYKDEFKEHVEEPFQEVLLHVADRLPAPIRDVMETKSGLFSRILKNDWGRGGAWDFYWGAFYPKGSKRTDSPQLFLSINYERLEAGFHIGEYGSEHRKRFLRNCKENYEALLPLLAEPLAQPGLTFGRRLTLKTLRELNRCLGKTGFESPGIPALD